MTDRTAAAAASEAASDVSNDESRDPIQPSDPSRNADDADDRVDPVIDEREAETTAPAPPPPTVPLTDDEPEVLEPLEPLPPPADADSDADVRQQQGVQTTNAEETSSYEQSPPPTLEPIRPPSPFRQGQIRLGAGVGWASTYSESWTILGVGAGFYVLDGLAIEFDSTFWVGGTPFVATTTPGVRYVFHFVPVVQPYLGTFYRHYFVNRGWSDTNSVGARAGVYFPLGPHVIVGGGAVYEHFLDDDLFVNRDDVYPELSIAFMF